MTSDPISDNVAAPRSKRPWRIAGALGIFGPGLIAASAGNDAGGIITYASAGAQFAYRTLFVMLDSASTRAKVWSRSSASTSLCVSRRAR
jgi:hypothetical protein